MICCSLEMTSANCGNSDKLSSSTLSELRLTLHVGRAQVRPVGEGFLFLGFVVFPNKRRIKRDKGIAYNRRFARLVRQYSAGDLSFDSLTASVQGWVNHAGYADTTGLRRAMFKSVVIKPPPRKESHSSVQSGNFS